MKTKTFFFLVCCLISFGSLRAEVKFEEFLFKVSAFFFDDSNLGKIYGYGHPSYGIELRTNSYSYCGKDIFSGGTLVKSAESPWYLKFFLSADFHRKRGSSIDLNSPTLLYLVNINPGALLFFPMQPVAPFYFKKDISNPY